MRKIKNDYNLAFAIVAQKRPLETTPATYIEREAAELAENTGTLELIEEAEEYSNKGYISLMDWRDKLAAEHHDEANRIWELTSFYPICIDGFTPILIQYKHDDCSVVYHSLPSANNDDIRNQVASIVPAWAYPLYQFHLTDN